MYVSVVDQGPETIKANQPPIRDKAIEQITQNREEYNIAANNFRENQRSLDELTPMISKRVDLLGNTHGPYL